MKLTKTFDNMSDDNLLRQETSTKASGLVPWMLKLPLTTVLKEIRAKLQSDFVFEQKISPVIVQVKTEFQTAAIRSKPFTLHIFRLKFRRYHTGKSLSEAPFFLHQLTHNMTTDCSLNYKFNT